MAHEKTFENKIKKFLKSQCAYFFKYWGGGTFTKAGIPDIIACVNGQFMGIEVKASCGRPSELQIYNLKQIDEVGGFAILLYPEDFDTFKNFIIALKEGEGNAIVPQYKKLKGRWKEWEQLFKSQ